MEYAVHIQSAEDIGRLHDLRDWERSRKLRPFVVDLLQRLGKFETIRVYYGTEFCENLIGPPEALAETYAGAQRAGLQFTLLTPYSGNRGLDKLRHSFQVLSELGDAEVVFNDWGVLRMLGREFPRLKPVQGRLLHKSLRDPRVMGEYAKSVAATGVTPTIQALRQSNLANGAHGRIHARYGVEMVEFDALPQGTDWSTSAMRAGVYCPFGFISTARVCMAAGLGYRKPDKFQPAAPCRHECQTHLVEYQYSNSPFENRSQRFWLKGNSYFFTYTEQSVNEILQAASSGLLSRIVVQPRIPMLEAEPGPRRVRTAAPLVQLQGI